MILRLTPRARRDRSLIYDRIAEHSPSGARNVVAAIQTTLGIIEQFPGSGRATDAPDIRSLPVPSYPYLVFYRLSGARVDVIHIRHSSRRSWHG